MLKTTNVFFHQTDSPEGNSSFKSTAKMVKHKTAAPEAKRTPTRAEVQAVQKVAKKSSQSREELDEASHEDSDELLNNEEEDDDEEAEEDDAALSGDNEAPKVKRLHVYCTFTLI